ncbi:Uncharacterized protein Zm00014a_035253 [Zea mays]|uniref:At2g23090-like zinc-binding domain-containing protein n=1 Tax=Zea mays TaxID=4577 RepID=A0A3L6DX65_MAIZE|nr:Uncharacterized protein Zm00014a_035253 [Zea mays]
MGGGNAQKSKMARERNAEKNKGGKGKYPTDPCPPAPRRRPLLTVSSDSVDFRSVFACRQPAGGQQEGHEHPGYSVRIRQIQPRRDSRTLIVNHGYAFPFIFILLYCKICMQTFICTTSEAKCKEHAEARHPKNDLYQCFPHLKN